MKNHQKSNFFLNGDTSYVVKNLEEEMNVASSALDFEKLQHIVI